MKKALPALLLALCLLLTACEFTIVFEPSPTGEPAAALEKEETLMVHFLDVGQADCALIEFCNQFILIDGGNVEDSRRVISFLEQQGVRSLEAIICTHTHEDHVGGLPAVLAVYPTEAVYAPTRVYASNVFDDFLRYTDQQDLTVTIPAPGDRLTLTHGDAQVVLTVLGPVKSYFDTNNTSIVTHLSWGDTAFLFTGDMEIDAENDMLDYWGDRFPRADLLKVGHHGSETSSGYRLIYEVRPDYALISVGEGNTYGHPHEIPLSRLYNAGCTLFRTDEMGSVTAVSDGQEIVFTWENQSANPLGGEPGDTRLIGNCNSMKLHTSLCNYLPGEKNRVYFDSYQDAIEAGYIPCGSCME